MSSDETVQGSILSPTSDSLHQRLLDTTCDWTSGSLPCHIATGLWKLRPLWCTWPVTGQAAESPECGSSHCGQSQSLWPHHIHLRDSPLASCPAPYLMQSRTDDVQSPSSACAELHRRPAPVLPTMQNIAILIRLSSDFVPCASLLLACGTVSPWDAKMWLAIHL